MINQQKIFKYGFFALTVAIILILTLRGSSGTDDLYLNTLQDKVEQLEREKLQLSAQISRRNINIEQLENVVASKDREIEDADQRRLRTIRYYETQISNIDDYTATQLDSFFIARYPHPIVESPQDSTRLN